MRCIIACDPAGGIGYRGRLPWEKISGDLSRFKQLTQGQTVIMGRKTWESLPHKPLPNRINVVVSSSSIPEVYTIPNCETVDYLELSDAWIIGGAQLIKSNWYKINTVHLTKTFSRYECDTFIDLDLLYKEFDCISSQTHTDHTYEVYQRKLIY